MSDSARLVSDSVPPFPGVHALTVFLQEHIKDSPWADQTPVQFALLQTNRSPSSSVQAEDALRDYWAIAGEDVWDDLSAWQQGIENSPPGEAVSGTDNAAAKLEAELLEELNALVLQPEPAASIRAQIDQDTEEEKEDDEEKEDIEEHLEANPENTTPVAVTQQQHEVPLEWLNLQLQLDEQKAVVHEARLKRLAELGLKPDTPYLEACEQELKVQAWQLQQRESRLLREHRELKHFQQGLRDEKRDVLKSRQQLNSSKQALSGELQKLQMAKREQRRQEQRLQARMTEAQRAQAAAEAATKKVEAQAETAAQLMLTAPKATVAAPPPSVSHANVVKYLADVTTHPAVLQKQAAALFKEYTGSKGLLRQHAAELAKEYFGNADDIKKQAATVAVELLLDPQVLKKQAAAFAQEYIQNHNPNAARYLGPALQQAATSDLPEVDLFATVASEGQALATFAVLQTHRVTNALVNEGATYTSTTAEATDYLDELERSLLPATATSTATAC